MPVGLARRYDSIVLCSRHHAGADVVLVEQHCIRPAKPRVIAASGPGAPDRISQKINSANLLVAINLSIRECFSPLLSVTKVVNWRLVM